MTENTIDVIQLGAEDQYGAAGYVYFEDGVTMAYTAGGGLSAIEGAREPDEDQLARAVAELISRGIWPAGEPGAESASATEVVPEAEPAGEASS